VVVEALRALWEASDHLCSKRLKPFLPELIVVMRRCGECGVTVDIEAQLCQMSAATIDRVLRPWRQKGGHRSLSTTRPGSLLRSAIPIRTFADWLENRPGFVEVDTVAHCGESADGFYLNTLMAVDVATGWSEFIGVLGKGQERIRTAVHHVQERLPFPLLGLDSDNGSEFINQHLAGWCQREGITFTRSRPYKKNDPSAEGLCRAKERIHSETRGGAREVQLKAGLRGPEPGLLPAPSTRQLSSAFSETHPQDTPRRQGA
jgi:hypothetical protein